jgi:hypothetical protein
LPVDLEPDFDRFRPIIFFFFLKQTPFSAIAGACSLSRAFGQMKYRPAIDRRFGARPTASRSHGQAVDGSPPQPASALSVQQLLHELSLAERARKSIEDEFTSVL